MASIRLVEGQADKRVLHPPARQTEVKKANRRLAQFGLAVLAGLFVGAAMILADPFQHRVGALMQLAGSVSPDQFERYQRDLIEMVWGSRVSAGLATTDRPKWRVSVPAQGTLQIALDTSDAKGGLRQAEEVARRFTAQVATDNEAQWSKPSEGENFLQSHVAVLTARLDDAQRQLDAAVARLPAADPRPDKAGLTARWQTVRGDFDAARAELRKAAEEYKSLTQQGDPAQAVVSGEGRQAALAADVDLQQDIKELGATLTELKLHMLNVWQQSSAPLAQIESVSSTSFRQVSSDVDSIPASMRDAFAAIATEVSAFGEAAMTFTRTWNAEFADLQGAQVDMEGGALLDAYQRIRSLLNDFLYQAGNRLATIREKVNELSRDTSDDPQHHLRQSDAARAFAQLQAAHHRFEFAAGAIDTPTNFRLDSALRIARGLHRRVADRTRVIDERLQKEAVAKATEQRSRTLASLDEILRKSRDSSDSTMDELIALQDRLERASASSEQFVSAVAGAELAARRLQLTRNDLDQAQAQLRDLAEDRAQARRDANFQLVSAGVLETYVNMNERLRVAGVGTSVTFLAVLLGQILLARSLWPSR